MPIPSEITIILQRVLEEMDDISLEDEEDEYENDSPRRWVVADEAGANKNLGIRRSSTNTVKTDGASHGPSSSFLSRWDCTTGTANSRAIPSPRLPRRQGSKTDKVIVSPGTAKDTVGDLFIPDLKKNDSWGAGLVLPKSPSTGMLQNTTVSTCTGSNPPRLPQRTWQVDLVSAKAG
jgi:hypothetical protein